MKWFCKALILLSVLLSASFGSAQELCRQSMELETTEKRLLKIEAAVQSALSQLQELSQAPAERRTDIEVVAYFRKSLDPVMTQVRDVLNDKTTVTENMLSSGVGLTAEKDYVVLSRNLGKLAGHTALSKSIGVKFLNLLPGYSGYRANSLQVKIRDQRLKIEALLAKVETENKSLVEKGEKSVAALAELSDQIEVMKKVIEYLQSEQWTQGDSLSEVQKKAQRETLRYADKMLGELLELLAVNTALVQRIDETLDRNHEIAQNIHGFIGKDLSMVQSISDRQLDLSPQARPLTFSEKAAATISHRVSVASGHVGNIYKSVRSQVQHRIGANKLTLFLSIAAFAGVSHMTGFDHMIFSSNKTEAVVAPAAKTPAKVDNSVAPTATANTVELRQLALTLIAKNGTRDDVIEIENLISKINNPYQLDAIQAILSVSHYNLRHYADVVRSITTEAHLKAFKAIVSKGTRDDSSEAEIVLNKIQGPLQAEAISTIMDSSHYKLKYYDEVVAAVKTDLQLSALKAISGLGTRDDVSNSAKIIASINSQNQLEALTAILSKSHYKLDTYESLIAGLRTTEQVNTVKALTEKGREALSNASDAIIKNK